MDASASTKPDANENSVFNFFLTLDVDRFPTPSKQKSSVVKYTKLPDFDFDSKVSWPSQSYTLKPRLRRIISLGEDEKDVKKTRSLKSNPTAPSKIMATPNNFTKRKIVTISEDDEVIKNDLHPSFSKDKKILSAKTASRTSEADFKNKLSQKKVTPKLPNSNKSHQMTNCSHVAYALARTYSICEDYDTETEILLIIIDSKDTKPSVKMNNTSTKREVNVTQNLRGKTSSCPTAENNNNNSRNVKEKEKTQRNSRNLNPTMNTSKNFVLPSESEKELTKIRNILYDSLKSKSATYKSPGEKPKLNKLPHVQNKPRITFKDTASKTKQTPVIHVPLDDKKKKDKKGITEPSQVKCVVKTSVDCASETDGVLKYSDAETGTDPLPAKEVVNQVTQMQDIRINTFTTCKSIQTENTKETMFDSLDIPNVTLTKDKSEPKEDLKIFKTTSLPNLKVPPIKIVSQNEEMKDSDIRFCKGASYIISHATFTYTTRQKFNFQLVGNDDDVKPSVPPSPLDYPMSVVSVLKNELKNKTTDENVTSDDSYKNENTPREEYLNHLNDLKTLNCSYVYNKLMKPSDIISTIRVNNGLLQSDYICEQFQRELNFIDSFFESLQYLETCSLTDKCYPENKVETFGGNSVLFDATFDVRNSEYDNFLSKLENGASIGDTETMASKSLCLLNLLIRDEQRRAKNLLFVLKMREDALKDFTKSQILWLEKKKKHENTDISTLKKKQRGALLKLQHECGEMQRMRKALLTLSEKRKVALMKTKKNIELKLKNNVDVDQIILGKKKLKRSTCLDRNASPLKCFDLSSSGCEESSTSKANSEPSIAPAEPSAPASELVSVTSAEKCVQTTDVRTCTDHATDTAAENFVVVDGGYLNILFHNLALPQIFSSGKQYEVNEEALRNIVNSANNHNTNISGTEVVEKLMDQIKNKDIDRSSSSASTARSLIEEFDQYYKELNDDDKSRAATSEIESYNSSKAYKVTEPNLQTPETDRETEQPEEQLSQNSSLMTISSDSICHENDTSLQVSDEACVCETVSSVADECSLDKEPVTTSQTPTGPLPVPVGAAAVVDSQPTHVPTWLPPKSSIPSVSETDSVSSQSLCGSVSSIASLSAPVHVEAEELRRQQLAIEREIKALEQQQCRLLVVREIPDKPPPPYTPPTETRTPKPPRMFTPDENLEEKVEKFLTNAEGTSGEFTEAFSVFVQDFCLESLERHKQEQSDKPWATCNLLPQKPQVEMAELVGKTSSDLKDVLTTVAPAVVSGVSSRRSDHIDDILFCEWRRCEPEWTALHTDEAIVKNQIFESIFQKVLNNTIDEYKKTVQGEEAASE